jgi:O-antigen/teichoic acid export membrane protein
MKKRDLLIFGLIGFFIPLIALVFSVILFEFILSESFFVIVMFFSVIISIIISITNMFISLYQFHKKKEFSVVGLIFSMLTIFIFILLVIWAAIIPMIGEMC